MFQYRFFIRCAMLNITFKSSKVKIEDWALYVGILQEVPKLEGSLKFVDLRRPTTIVTCVLT